MNINILVPMAGNGSRFGSNYPPKPFIDINGKCMIDRCIESLKFDKKNNYIFYVRKELIDKLTSLTFLKNYNYKIIEVNKLTEGCASTCLLGVSEINNEYPVVIVNCDQIMDWNGEDFINYCINSDLDGVLVTYDSQSPKNSYVRLNNENLACEVAEKKVISKYSTNGISYWKSGKYFIESCIKMIANNDRTNNEFYVAPSYNYLIQENKKIGIYHINNNQHFAVGTPEDLERYLNYGNTKTE
jgi:NDP-sugar pyrophosphorylase family protein